MTGRYPDRERPRFAVFRGGERRVVMGRPGPAEPGPSALTRMATSGAGGGLGGRVQACGLGGARPDAKGRVVVGVNALEAVAATGTLITYGLGSCIAVVLFEPASRIGAMCHYMLPDSTEDPRRAADQPLMFGDLAIARLVASFTRLGGNLSAVETFVVGGASLAGMNDLFDIGGRNARMARATLARLRLAIRGEQTGGRASRTVTLDVATGAVVIKTPGLAPRRLR